MADGALDDQPELEPGVASPSSSIICEDDLSCPRPRYMLDGVFLGDDATDDFGLDAYEPRFFLPILDWIDQGVFSIELTFDDANVGQDFFYFCHVSTKYIASTPALAIRAHRCTIPYVDPSIHVGPHQSVGCDWGTSHRSEFSRDSLRIRRTRRV